MVSEGMSSSASFLSTIAIDNTEQEDDIGKEGAVEECTITATNDVDVEGYARCRLALLTASLTLAAKLTNMVFLSFAQLMWLSVLHNLVILLFFLLFFTVYHEMH